VKAATALVGLADFEASGIDQVRVARASTIIDASMLTDLITSDAARRDHPR
jgi:hypothetical protein